ncbi:ATP-binding protein, partial [Pseudomonas viridiflava]
YTLESALADLIDNSISAQAKTINIEFRPFDEPYIAVIDDGVGMSSDVLQNAMRHGSTSPLHQRKNDDMGRYGLGLKTSSLSQCRRLTVVSKFEGNI